MAESVVFLEVFERNVVEFLKRSLKENCCRLLANYSKKHVQTSLTQRKKLTGIISSLLIPAEIALNNTQVMIKGYVVHIFLYKSILNCKFSPIPYRPIALEKS